MSSYRYSDRYGWPTVRVWQFESWNEPDLRGFNVLDFNYSEYLAYLTGVRTGLHSISNQLQLRGPAGLFRTNPKRPDVHPLCWGLLRQCNANRSRCPIDTLTYHRKGTDGTAASILSGTLTLIGDIRERFPALADMPYANSEADPTAGWSHPLPGNANVQYAAVLVENVLLHWRARSATNPPQLPLLSGISHDNAFVSYHPFEFEQRTLFARFRMNRTGPPADEQLFEKPVYAAMGMLAGVMLGAVDGGQRVAAPQSTATCMWVTSRNTGNGNRLAAAYEWYASVLLVSRGNNVSQQLDDEDPIRDDIRVRIEGVQSAGVRLLWFVEYLEHQQTDPHHVWIANGRPAYPKASVRAAMRHAQGPFVLIAPQPVSSSETASNTSSTIAFSIGLRRPWLVAVRICPAQMAAAYAIRSLRARRINAAEVLLVWSLRRSHWQQNRCIRTYQVHYRSTDTDVWQTISSPHNPFMSYHHRAAVNQTTHGLYAVQAIDLAGRLGHLSKTLQYSTANTQQ